VKPCSDTKANSDYLTQSKTGSNGTPADEMIHQNRMEILDPLLVGLAATLGTLVIHGLVVHRIIVDMRRDLQRSWLGARLWVNFTFVSGTTVLALAAHALEVVLWAFVFDLCGGVADFRAALYCSAGDYTTLGPGEFVLSTRWRLLGPLEAAVALMMFGVSTALIFAVIQRLIQARFAATEPK
jgi:hypothetical protein